MQKTLKVLALMALLAVPWAASAQTTNTIVADNGATNSYIPIYGYWADAAQHNQILYSEDVLADIPGVTISGMKFYASSSPSWGVTATVSMAIVESTTLSSLNTSATFTQVWTGTVNISNNEWAFTFDTPFTYSGGNLLVDIVTTAGSYSSGSFYGMNTSSAMSYYQYNGTGGSQNFVPKTEFTHTIPILSCYRPTDLTASNITSSSVDLTWIDTMNSGATYTVYYWKGTDTLTETTTATSITLSNLDDNSDYHCNVVANCSSTDVSNHSNTINVHTDCLNGSCDITVTSSSGYNYSSYCPTLTVYQNGAQLASVNATTQQINVCSGDTVIVLYNAPNYTFYTPNATILDGGGTPLFDGSTSSYSTGDTLAVIAVPCPSCLPPTALQIDNVTENSISFTWSPRSGATLFAVYLGDSLVNNYVTDTFYAFSNLSSNTQYSVRVQSICSSDDSSSIVGINARTECGTMTLPFFEDFNSYGYGAFPQCWHRVLQHGTDPSVNTEISGLNGTMYMFLMAQNDTNLFVSPSTVPLAGDQIHVSYDAYLGGSGSWIKAGVMTNYNDVSTFVTLDSVGYHNFNNNFESRDFNTSSMNSSESYYIAWMYFNTTTSTRGAVDNISIAQHTGCDRPSTAYAPANVTAHSVDLAWSEVAGVSGYTVYYGTVNDPSNSNLLSASTTDTTVTLTNLNSETHYYAWVVSNCGSDESDVRPISSFTTLVSCPAVTGLTVDTTTSDGATISWHTQGTETEWAVVLDSDNVVIVYDSTYTVTGLNSMTGHTVYVRPVCGSDDTGAVRSINFATRCSDPTCNITVNGTDSYGDGWNGNYINIYQAGIQLGSVTISSGSSVTENVEVCSTAPVEIRYTSGSYASEMGGTVTDGGGNVVFTISNMGSHSTGDLLATVSTPCPDCIMPVHIYLDSTSLTANTATIYWNGGDAGAWIVRVDSTDYYVTDTFYTFSSLDARTQYTIYVATDCNGDTSMFNSISFTTDCNTGSCDISVAMSDSYGDGWNGGSLSFYQNGVLAGTASLALGSNGTATVNVCSGLTVTYSWNTGSYDSEVSYVIYDGGGMELYNSANGTVNHSDSVANACPTCLTPNGLHATLMDSTELMFEWTNDPSVNHYIVSFNGGAWSTTSGNTYYESGLTPNTAYTISVKAVCVPGVDTSNARTITMKTGCGQMVVPYVESFEADAQGTVPSCWTVVRTGYGNYPGVSGSAHTGSNAMTLAANYNDSTTIATSAVPLAGDSIYVSFWASVNSGNTLQAGVMTNLAYDSTFIPIMSIPGNGSTYTLYEFNTSSLGSIYTNTTFYVAFRLVTGGNNHYADVDDINIRLDEGCMYPANLTAIPAATSVDLEWSANGVSMGNYVVQYKTGTATTWDSAGTTTDTTFTVTSLTAATFYTLRVGLVCGTDTLWTSVNTVTLCDLLPVPYFENFYSTTGELPPCWDYQSPVGWNNWPLTSGNGELMFGANSSGVPAVMPQFDANFTKLQITFYTKCRPDSEGDGILIGVADAAGNLIQWIDTLYHPNHSQAAWVEHTYNFLNYSGPGERIALGRKLNGAGNLWASIDSITVVALADCYPVDSLTAHNLIDPDHTSFTWQSQGEESQWQVYVDTVTVNIDSVPDSLFTIVYDTSYSIPMGTIQGGGIYKFYVRADCEVEQSSWVSYEFGAGTVIMNNNTVADTVVGCGMVVYDNGGPVAGYLDYSNSNLVILSENAGSELQIFGGKFGWGETAITLTVYDGEGTAGNVLYQVNNTGTTNYTLDSILATSTTGAMTITFTCNGNYVHTGYELYIHCVGTAICERPTQLHAEMTFLDEADVTWYGSSAAYELYYKPSGASVWGVENSTTTSAHLTNLIPDTTYDIYVVGICGNETSTPSFPITLNTHFEVNIEPCDPATELTYSDVSTTSAVLNWTSEGETWEVEVKHLNTTDTIIVNTKPYTLTDLLPTMQYNFRVRTVCDNIFVEPYSEWSNTVTFTTLTPDHGSIENADNSMLSLYPNPASTMVTLSVGELMVGSTVSIVDVNGRVVTNFEIRNSKFGIDLSTLAKGAYFVRIVGEQATAVRKLIVK